MKPLWLTMVDEKFWPMADAHFLPSFKATGMYDDFELRISASEDLFGDFGMDDYNTSYSKEMALVREVIAVNFGRLIVWSDIDIRFYCNFTHDIAEAALKVDICTNMDRVCESPVRCTGLQAFIAGDKILRFYDEWIAENSKPGRWNHAQESFNSVLDRAKAQYLSVTDLDVSYWSIGLSDIQKFPWDLGDPISQPPANMKMHHGNFTLGLDNKMALMQAVWAARLAVQP